MKKALSIWFYSITFSLILISSAQAFNFAVISDIEVAALDTALDFIISQDVDFIIVPGDFYYDGQDYYPHFVRFGFDVRPETEPDQQNVYFILGNHDAPPFGDDDFINLIAPYYPKNGPENAPQGTVFSFDRNNCHFVVTNQYWNYPSGGYTDEQLNWIDQDLAASDQAFKFIFGHEPAFPLDRHIGNSLDADPAQRDLFWQILVENSVQAFFCGHTHNLSHILDQGVYQIDSGKVEPSFVCVTIVDVADEMATIKSYKIGELLLEQNVASEKNSVPAFQIDPVIETDIDLNAAPENVDNIEILYSTTSEPGFCFIGKIVTRSTSE